MPLRWKKTTRCSRFSQLIADHLQSRRRGGSLVVQTGFPTSLIDLYVRNRGKLRKFSEKRESGNDFSSTELNNSSSMDLDFRESDEIVEKGVGVEVMVEDLSEHFENSNWVLAAAMKLLLMAALALGTKRFTVGITLSAFLLHFLVFVGKPWMRRLRLSEPCLGPRKLFESFVHGIRKIRSSKAISTPVVRNQVLEIEEVVEDLKEEIVVANEPNEVRCEVLVGVMHKSSHRAKMKSKVMKLVPKMFRTSKKHCLDSNREITCRFKEEDTNHAPKKLETSKKCCLDSKCEIPSGFKEEDTWDLPKTLPASKKFCLDP